MAKGLDTATPCSQGTIDAIIQAGYTFIVRYYCTGNLSKRLKLEEAQRLSDSGLWVVSVFQDYNNSISRFSAPLGKANGKSACQYARDVSVFQDYNNAIGRFSVALGEANAKSAHEYASCVIGQPCETPIYFAVDFDATDGEAKGAVRDYFEAINSAFATAIAEGRYKVGVYGSGAVCRYIKDDAKLAEYSWLSMSTGWRGYRDYNGQNRWNLKQIKAIEINGVEFDTNESNPVGGGGWRIRAGTAGIREK